MTLCFISRNIDTDIICGKICLVRVEQTTK